jgi:DNA-nicking Smr family endonuclease
LHLYPVIFTRIRTSCLPWKCPIWAGAVCIPHPQRLSANIATTFLPILRCSTHLANTPIAALNHSSADTEAEYDRLRDLARQEAAKRGSCFDKAHQAYESGDGARAHQLSEEGKQHAAKMEQYNRQARDYIFRANNTNGRVDGDTIDLHGLFVEEAEDVLEERIKAARSRGETHLHVIVGKGNHSTNHVQKIKPRVEQVCRELGLQYRTEANEGRMYVDLTGGNVDHMPPPPSGYAGYPGGQQHGGQQHGGQQHGGQQHHGGQQQHGGQHQQQNQDDDIEQMVKKGLPKFLKKLGCCTVM